jgi:hypothetical protein
VHGGGSSKVAVTTVSAESVIEQFAVPEQPPPLQPVNTLPGVGVAARIMTAPAAKVPDCELHWSSHWMPPGTLTTPPVEAPALLIVRLWTVVMLSTSAAALSEVCGSAVPPGIVNDAVLFTRVATPEAASVALTK